MARDTRSLKLPVTHAWFSGRCNASRAGVHPVIGASMRGCFVAWTMGGSGGGVGRGRGRGR
jgi:hypothetical protein